MPEKISLEKSARTIEEAILAALEELSVPRDQVQIEVLEEPKSGLFGIGAKQALVRVSRELTEEEIVGRTARDLVQYYDPGLTVRIEKQEESYFFDVESLDPAGVIGKHGETINALQFLLSLMLAKKGVHVRCLLDSGRYRARREATLSQMARRLGDRVRRMRRPYTMPPLPPMERRVIHVALQGRDDVKTHSEGQEPYRKVVIEPVLTEGYAARPRSDRGERDDRQQRGERTSHSSRDRRQPDRGRESRSSSQYEQHSERKPPERKPVEQKPREEIPSIPSPMTPSRKWLGPIQPSRPTYSPKSSMRYTPPRKK